VTLWIDAQLSPALASWVTQTFDIPAAAVRELGMRDAADQEIFEAARKAKATVLTKDSDFVHLLERFGPPPQVIWLTCGNTSRASSPAPCPSLTPGLGAAQVGRALGRDQRSVVIA